MAKKASSKKKGGGGGGGRKADEAIPLLPKVSDIQSTAKALKVKRKLIEAGRPMDAKRWMQRWYDAQKKDD